jgi:hypothetical protein
VFTEPLPNNERGDDTHADTQTARKNKREMEAEQEEEEMKVRRKKETRVCRREKKYEEKGRSTGTK